MTGVISSFEEPVLDRLGLEIWLRTPQRSCSFAADAGHDGDVFRGLGSNAI